VPGPGRDADCGAAQSPFSRGDRPCSRPLGPLASSAICPPAARPVAAPDAACVRGRRRGGARGAATLDDALQQRLGCAQARLLPLQLRPAGRPWERRYGVTADAPTGAPMLGKLPQLIFMTTQCSLDQPLDPVHAGRRMHHANVEAQCVACAPAQASLVGTSRGCGRAPRATHPAACQAAPRRRPAGSS